MSEEEVLEALETIKSTLLGTAHRFSPVMRTVRMLSKSVFIKHGGDGSPSRILSISKHGRRASLLMSAKRCSGKKCLSLWKQIIIQFIMKMNMNISLSLIRFTRQWKG